MRFLPIVLILGVALTAVLLRSAAPRPKAGRTGGRIAEGEDASPERPLLAIRGSLRPPVAGAFVLVGELLLRTGEDGAFAAEVACDGKLRVVAWADGYQAAGTEALPGGPPFVLELQPDSMRTCRIQDEEELPVVGASVEVFPLGLDGPCIETLVSDRSGTVSLPARLEACRVRAAGFAHEAIDGGIPRIIVLRTGYVIAGEVVDTSGAPVSDAELRVEDPASKIVIVFEPLRVVPADTGGLFRIEGLPLARYGVECVAPGYASARRELWPGNEEVRFVLEREAVVSGRVFASDGVATETARVYTLAGAPSGLGPDGRFRIEKLPAGPLWIQADAYGAASRALELDVAPGPTVDGLELLLEEIPPDLEAFEPPHSYVNVRVLDAGGDPVRDVAVTVLDRPYRPAGAVRGLDGRAAVPGLPDHRCLYWNWPTGFGGYWPTDHNGVVRIRASFPPGTEAVVRSSRWPAAEAVARTHADPDGEIVTIRCPQPIRFTFVLRGPQGEAVDGRVSLQGNGRCIDGGRDCWSFLLERDSSYRVAIDAPGYGPRVLEPWRPPEREALQVVSLRKAVAVEAPAPRIVTGTVRDARGRPVGGVLVQPLRPNTVADRLQGAVATDREGRFRIRLAEPGVRLSRDGFGTIHVPLAVAGDLVLPPPGRLRIRLEFPDHLDSEEWRVDLGHPVGDTIHWDRMTLRPLFFPVSPPDRFELTDACLRPGDWHGGSLPAKCECLVDDLGSGPLTVRLWNSGYDCRKTVTIEPGRTGEVRFTVE